MLFPIWSSTGDQVRTIGWFDPVAFPMDGSGPHPLLTGTCPSLCNDASPDGSLRAWAQLVSAEDNTSRLIVARADSNASLTFNPTFNQVEGVYWTSDGRRVLVKSFTNGNYQLWEVDPAVGLPALVAEKITFFGTLDMLRQRSTEVGAKSMTLPTLPAPGDLSTWNTHTLPGLGVRVRVPPQWRFDALGSGITQTATLANFEYGQAAGCAVLGSDQIEITFQRIPRPGFTDFSRWLTETARIDQDEISTDARTLAGHPAARVRLIVSPVSEQVRVPLRDGTELWITRRPLASSQSAIFEQVLNSLEWIPTAGMVTPESSNVPNVFPLASDNS
jgi:hypothetical protein